MIIDISPVTAMDILDRMYDSQRRSDKVVREIMREYADLHVLPWWVHQRFMRVSVRSDSMCLRGVWRGEVVWESHWDINVRLEIFGISGWHVIVYSDNEPKDRLIYELSNPICARLRNILP